MEGKNYMTQFYTIRSRFHDIHTELVTKTALSSDDNKRYLLEMVAMKRWRGDTMLFK